LISNNHVEEYFNFIGRYPATQIPEFFALCDASLICLSKNRVFEITLPAKTQSCFACGLPILVSADGEIQKVVNDARAGFCSNAGDATGLAENIVKFCELSEAERLTMSNNALAYADKNYNKETLLARMDRWLSE
jgi:glycosyltransferase involved in cell wall biosynthesis